MPTHNAALEVREDPLVIFKPPRLGALSLAPNADANKALLAVITHSTPLAIVEGNRVIGLLSQADTVKWLLLHQKQ